MPTSLQITNSDTTETKHPVNVFGAFWESWCFGGKKVINLPIFILQRQLQNIK